jgi:ribosomal protein S27AE
MSFTSIPDPDGTKKTCTGCGESTVLVSTGTGTERVHCGTYAARCHTTTTARRRTR